LLTSYEKMKTISLLAQKGGAGKTTLALHWAVEAGKAGPEPVVVIDMDPQASATKWYRKRKDKTPVLIQTDTPQEALEACKADGIGLTILDTAPHAFREASKAAGIADLVVIPCRPSILDLEGIEDTVRIAKEAGAPAVIVLNAARPRGRLTDEAREALKVYGLPVCPTALVQRAALADALIDGRGVQELEPRSKAAAEITATWEWIKRRL